MPRQPFIRYEDYGVTTYTMLYRWADQYTLADLFIHQRLAEDDYDE